MDLALPRFAGLTDGPRQVHPPWSVTSDSPVSRTVSTSPFTLGLTAKCTSGVKVPPLGASTQVVLPPATVDHTEIAADTSTPFVSTPAPVVEQPEVQAKGFPTLWLVESPESLPSFGWPSPSPSPTLPWGAAEDSSPPFSPNRVQSGPSQDAPDVDSLFDVSPLSPGLFFRHPQGSGSPPAGGVLLPTTLDDFDDSVLGDPITYARCENFSGSESTIVVACVCVAARFGLSAGFYDTSDCVGSGVLRTAGGGALNLCPSFSDGGGGWGRLLETGLPGCPYRFSESGDFPFTDGNPAYGLLLHHPRFLELVGAPESARLLDCSPTFWVDKLGEKQAMAAAINLQRDAGVMLSNLHILSQFAMEMNGM